MSIRKLASIQKVIKLEPIPNADFIVKATILGWECVVKKDEFKEGDMCVYFEVDSILPQNPTFEFMRERKFRVKTLKFKGQYAQGLALPLSILPKGFKIEEDMDVTEILGVTKFDRQAKAEADALNALMNQKKKPPKWLMNMAWFRWCYFKLNPTSKGIWPSWVQKTDETRVQVCVKRMMQNYGDTWYITEKLDGQSASYFSFHKRVWGVMKKKFGVGSREVWRKTKDNSTYWKMSDKYNIENKLMEIDGEMTVQGEIVGPSIQKNKYKLNEVDLYVFNVILDGNQLDFESTKSFCQTSELKLVPVLRENFVPSKEFGELEAGDVVKKLVAMSIGDSVLLKGCKREGLVFRLVNNPSVSFKVINPEFAAKEDKEEEAVEV